MSNLKNPHQRVGVFVDVQNLYYSAKALYGHKVDFNEVLKESVGKRQLIRAIAYTVKADMPEEQSFFDALESIGFEVKSKELQIFVGGQKKGDWDVGIAVDILKMAPKLDVIVLCSGDGDYADLLHHAKAEGCRTEAISFGRSTSAKLLEEVDGFFDMDKDNKRFVLSNKPTSQRRSTGTKGQKKETSKEAPKVVEPKSEGEKSEEKPSPEPKIKTSKRGWFK